MGGHAGFSLDGRTALVTGSVRGLGLKMARGLAQAGARVVLNGRDPGALGSATTRLRAEGLVVEGAAFDVTDLDEARDAAAGIGRVDVLVNNVGHRDRRGVDVLEPSDMARMLHVHLTSAYALSQAVARSLIARGAPGHIVNVSSVIGQLGRSGDVAYATVKAGLDGLTRALSADLGHADITVNSVAPGAFATEVNARLAEDPQWTDWLRSRTALGRWGAPRRSPASSCSSPATRHVRHGADDRRGRWHDDHVLTGDLLLHHPVASTRSCRSSPRCCALAAGRMRGIAAGTTNST